MKCPNCDASLGTVANFADDSRIAIAITPAAGEMFDLKTIGGTLTNFAKLLEAVGKEVGQKTIVLLERVEANSDGGLTFHAIVCRTGDRKTREASA